MRVNELYIRLLEDRRGRRDRRDRRDRRVHPAVLGIHPEVRQNHQGRPAAVPGIHPGVLRSQGRRCVGDHPAAVPGIRPGVRPEVRRDPAGDRAGDHPRGSCARRAYRGGG
ncbi:hypothetical protein N7465_011370 [Penicillium sp. CMV-2018d]|nr:hypothetical protein N7465_011370 [Penicillium sp. CMV-2018d]